MSTPHVIVATVIEDSGAYVMARVHGNDAANITQATLSGITWIAYDRRDENIVQESESLTIADVVFDSLQTDARWTKDSIGYNFGHWIPHTVLATGDTPYRIEYRFVPVTGYPFVVPATLETIALTGS